MESTKDKRVWHRGPPPHVGWWNASKKCGLDVWRWWNGIYWSSWANSSDPLHMVICMAGLKDPHPQNVEWSDYWPEDARVPRINPNKR